MNYCVFVLEEKRVRERQEKELLAKSAEVHSVCAKLRRKQLQVAETI